MSRIGVHERPHQRQAERLVPQAGVRLVPETVGARRQNQVAVLERRFHVHDEGDTARLLLDHERE